MFTYENQRKNRFVGSFSIPVQMFLSRPETERNYKMDDFSFGGIMRNWHSSPEAKLLKNGLYIHGALEYQFKRTNRFQPSFSYAFNYCNL